MIHWILAICIEILRNLYWIVGRKIKPVYPNSLRWRIFGGLVVFIWINKEFDQPTFDILTFGVFQITSFFLLFDLGLNLVRNLRWDYQGTESGWTDKLNKGPYYALKIACLILFILSSINLWQAK